ncbi:hypothetical protein TNCT_528781, partial [Trichonephila clavata]
LAIVPSSSRLLCVVLAFLMDASEMSSEHEESVKSQGIRSDNEKK